MSKLEPPLLPEIVYSRVPVYGLQDQQSAVALDEVSALTESYKKKIITLVIRNNARLHLNGQVT